MTKSNVDLSHNDVFDVVRCFLNCIAVNDVRNGRRTSLPGDQ